MEELKDDITKVKKDAVEVGKDAKEKVTEEAVETGKDVKKKVKEKARKANKRLSEVRESEFTFSGDALIKTGVALGGTLIALVGKTINSNRREKKQELETQRQEVENGVLRGRLSEIREEDERKARMRTRAVSQMKDKLENRDKES